MIWLVFAVLGLVLFGAWLLRRVRSGDAPPAEDVALGGPDNGAPWAESPPESPSEPSDESPYEDLEGLSIMGGEPHSDHEPTPGAARPLAADVAPPPLSGAEPPAAADEDLDGSRVGPATTESPPAAIVDAAPDALPEAPAGIGGRAAAPTSAGSSGTSERHPQPDPGPATSDAARASLPDDDVWDRILGMVRGEIPVDPPEKAAEDQEAAPVPELEVAPLPALEAASIPELEVDPVLELESATPRRCGLCREVGHDRRSCPQQGADSAQPLDQTS